MSGELRIPGREPTNNPLLVLAQSITEGVANPLKRMADALEHDSQVNDHRYAVAVAELPQHGKVWGTYCTGCSAAASQYVYPCAKAPDEPIKPPPYFTIGRAFTPRGDGSFLVNENGTPIS